jgi:anaerobic selenocysteine-containing dehydrogenase
MPTTSYRTCPLCEATCGLELVVEDGAVTRIRGDREDVFSKGFICPKGSTLWELHTDPDRLRSPQIRTGDGWRPATWDEAFAIIEERLTAIVAESGPDSVGVYLGNPNVHGPAGLLYLRPLVRALGTKNVFSATSVDQLPKHVSSGLMFGHPATIPVPDIDRTDYLLMLGANPKASNGSLATAPDWPGRMQAIRDRGGRVVVVDPRRTESAELADEHVFIRPGSDAAWLAAIATEIMTERLASPGRLADFTNGLDALGDLLAPFTPESVAAVTGIDADVTRRIAREVSGAPTAVVYGRIGTHTALFGTLASWLVDILNLLTGNLDRPGGAMFPRSAMETPRTRPFRPARWTSRVRGLPEMLGELPVATLADEITEPGDGRIRAMVTVAGNPARSTPDSTRLERALEGLDFMVSVDPYLNETTRHADVVLPPPSHLERSHIDIAFAVLSVRNVINYSPATFPPEGPEEWEILLRLTAIAAGMGAGADLAMLDDFGLSGRIAGEVADPASCIAGRDPEEILRMLEPRRGPERVIDYLVRIGPYGDAFGSRDGLTLAALEAAPHGIDLGPLEPRLPELICTASGRIEAAPQWITGDLTRLAAAVAEGPDDRLLLIGRRHVRSNNSWMHNVPSLMRGRRRDALHVNPDDAAAAGIGDGDSAVVTTETGSVTATVRVTDDVMRGVVSLPHGWGHDDPNTRMSVASRHPGANMNALTGPGVDPISGTAVLTAIPVTISRA